MSKYVWQCVCVDCSVWLVFNPYVCQVWVLGVLMPKLCLLDGRCVVCVLLGVSRGCMCRWWVGLVQIVPYAFTHDIHLHTWQKKHRHYKPCLPQGHYSLCFHLLIGRTPHAVGHGPILLMMGIIMPKTCSDRMFDQKHQISYILLVLSLHLIVTKIFKTKQCISEDSSCQTVHVRKVQMEKICVTFAYKSDTH